MAAGPSGHLLNSNQQIGIQTAYMKQMSPFTVSLY